MGKRYQSFLCLAALVILCLLPQKTFAKDREVNFNKTKTVMITQEECYAVSGDYTWLRYQPSADGYLTLQALDASDVTGSSKGYLALYNSTKSRVLSSASIFYNTVHTDNAYWHKFIFGMQKGQIYYIRVKGDNAVRFSRTFTKTNDKSGYSRLKAATLKKNKTKTGLIPAGVTNTDWYRVKLTKKQKLRLHYVARTNGSFRISVYSGKDQIAGWTIHNTAGQKLTVCQRTQSTTKSTTKITGMNPGTYYIKIERANATSSGYYKIKWN